MAIPDVLWVEQRSDLPGWLLAGIGKVAVEWSTLEHEFEDAIRLLMSVDIKRGRVVTTDMSIKSRVMVTQHLLHAHDLDQTFHKELEKLGSQITNKLYNDRNKVVHGLWGRIEGDWYVLRNSGTRKRSSENNRKVPRSVLPQREKIGKPEIQAIIDKIIGAREHMDRFRLKLERALPPSPHKSPRQNRQPHPSRKRRKPTR